MPGRVKIGAKVLSVQRTKLPTKYFGRIDCRLGTIEIGLKMHEGQVRDTLLHEVMHGCLFQLGVDGEKELTVEEFIVLLAPSLLAALYDNAELVAYLTEEEVV